MQKTRATRNQVCRILVYSSSCILGAKPITSTKKTRKSDKSGRDPTNISRTGMCFLCWNVCLLKVKLQWSDESFINEIKSFAVCCHKNNEAILEICSTADNSTEGDCLSWLARSWFRYAHLSAEQILVSIQQRAEMIFYARQFNKDMMEVTFRALLTCCLR